MNNNLIALLEVFARQRGVDLAPDFRTSINVDGQGGVEDLSRVAAALGWKAPSQVDGRPRPNQFPLMVYSPIQGWGIATQWESIDHVRVQSEQGSERWTVTDQVKFFDQPLPEAVGRNSTPRAVSIFWRSLLLRKKVFISAIIATIIINLVALGTSLFSMQVYDRVIPRSGFSTLWVLTAGVLFALLIDFTLRTTRALMIEREAAKIDAEVSEFFFARALAVRLDARPSGIGTMAAQLRGLEQVRALLGSASIFLIADLPFALFFIFVIAALSGIVAIIPIVSFPLALALAYLFSVLIRKDAAKAQLSGNRKNGLLVESLDAAETVKANRGGWHMLARWNNLMDELQLHEDPVKRWSAIAGSVFSSLQQVAYVLIVAVGAIQVSNGEMTMGALIAVTIIAGRVNGPLVSQLPNFLIQWAYARSSLASLDGILALPMDRSGGLELLRPDNLGGSIKVEDVRFVYPGATKGLSVPALEIKQGERVAFIGGVGSGKSTLLRLIAGLYAPLTGSVTIGGLDMHQIAEDILRNHIGYLPQDTRMLNGTLRENILLGMPNPGDEAVMTVAEELGLSSMIAAHPMGLDLPIAEGGRGLSGGQRTLAGLTRLMLSKPKVWLLDEPTANLDQATEAKVLATIKDQVAASDTLILVTHRLQLLALVDRVIVVTNGQIIMDGPVQAVLAKLKQPNAVTVANRRLQVSVERRPMIKDASRNDPQDENGSQAPNENFEGEADQNADDADNAALDASRA